MAQPTSSPAVVLTAGVEEPSLGSMLGRDRYGVVHVPTGTLALKWARELQPDAIILDAELPDMSGIDACRLLYDDLRIGGKVPILILAPEEPASEQRASALSAGARDCLPPPRDPEELPLKLHTHVATKPAADAALGEDTVCATAGLHRRPGFRRP